MKYIVTIPGAVEAQARSYLFQNHLEQGVFLFARPVLSTNAIQLDVVDAYLVPPEGWAVQHEVYLEMTDAERANIMKRARESGTALIDCHSHPNSGRRVSFSPSDVSGITDFAAYAKWKLDGRPYTATVWGEDSLDAVGWYGAFQGAERVEEVRVLSSPVKVWRPRGTWFEPRTYRDSR